jgi:hypothetical protein
MLPVIKLLPFRLLELSPAEFEERIRDFRRLRQTRVGRLQKLAAKIDQLTPEERELLLVELTEQLKATPKDENEND